MAVRVLHVLSSLDIGGGVQAMLMNIYRNIDKNLVQFDFVAYSVPDKQSYKQEIESLGGRVFQIDSPGKAGSIRFIFKLAELIKKNGVYDVVHCHNHWQNALIMIAAKISGIKRIISHSHVKSSEGFLKNLAIPIFQMLIRMYCTQLLACSEDAGKSLYGQKTKFQVIPSAIEINKYMSYTSNDIYQLRESLFIPDDALIVGHVGRFSKEKNHLFFISILHELIKWRQNTILIFVGDGETKEEVERQFILAELSTHVRFVGLRSDVSRFLKMFDVLVLPSLHEGLGMILIEAQAAGIVSIASNNVPSCADIGLGMIIFLSLEAGTEIWVASILNSVKTAIPIAEERIYALKIRGYEINEIISKIYELYTI